MGNTSYLIIHLGSALVSINKENENIIKAHTCFVYTSQQSAFADIIIAMLQSISGWGLILQPPT